MHKMSDGKTNFLGTLTQKSTISFKGLPGFKQLIAHSAANHVGTKGTGAIGTIAWRDKARCAFKARCARME